MDRMTVSIIKADIGSVGGHITPSDALLEAVISFMEEHDQDLLTDFAVHCIGDDISLLMVHAHGDNNPNVHKLGLDCLNHGADVARHQGLYGAGQDLDANAFSGNVRGMGPAVAELTFKPRKAEAFIFFAADKTECGAYSLPLYLGFADPMHAPGLILADTMKDGFTFRVLDVHHTEADKTIDLAAPADLYDLAALLRDNGRYHVESIWNTRSKEVAVRTSTCRARIDSKGKMKGKDDPVMICRVQGDFPSTGELISAFRVGHFTGGAGRGSHATPLMPVEAGSPVGFFDGPASVMAVAYSVSSDGKLTEGVDLFEGAVWDAVRRQCAEKFLLMRDQGFSGPAMLPMQDLEYGGVAKRIKGLDARFTVGG